jgi:hypothetical protein
LAIPAEAEKVEYAAFSKRWREVTFVEHAPYLGAQSEGVRQRLKNNIAIGRPVTMPTQGGQTKRMGGVVGEIKAAFQ